MANNVTTLQTRLPTPGIFFYISPEHNAIYCELSGCWRRRDKLQKNLDRYPNSSSVWRKTGCPFFDDLWNVQTGVAGVSNNISYWVFTPRHPSILVGTSCDGVKSQRFYCRCLVLDDGQNQLGSGRGEGKQQ